MVEKTERRSRNDETVQQRQARVAENGDEWMNNTRDFIMRHDLRCFSETVLPPTQHLSARLELMCDVKHIMWT